MSDSDQVPNLLYLLLLLVLVGSAFFARRIPLRQSVKMLLAWVLVFGLVFIGFTLKDPIVRAGRQLLTEARGVESTGETLRIKASSGGHFWIDATLNGASARFMVDSGATVTTISSNVAERAGIRPSGSFKAAVSTANGVVMVDRGRADSIKVGPITREDFAVHISDSLGGTNVLGMNFLSSLSGWGVEDGWLVLRA